MATNKSGKTQTRPRAAKEYAPKRTPEGMMGGSYVPMEMFGVDHWSTLGYAGAVMGDCEFFQVGFDPKMRQCRSNHRVMMAQCIQPKRRSSRRVATEFAMVMDDQNGSRLSNGTFVPGHDDWHCLQDLAQAGMLELHLDGERIIAKGGDVQPGAMLFLSKRGRAVVLGIFLHEESGRRIADFRPDSAALSIEP